MWLAFLSVLYLSIESEAARCRALVVGGGTDLGAYEGGAIMGLISGLPSGEAQWDVITGVGVGSVNALIVSMYAKGQESAASSKLNSFWSGFSYATFYQDWTGGYVTGLLLKSGLYDSTPMQKTLSTLQTGSFQRVLGVGTTDLISSNYVYFSSSQQSDAAMKTGIYASAADYGIFPIVKYGAYQLISGNVIYSADLLSAIDACTAKGAADSDISIDVVLGAGKTISSVDASQYKSLQALMRYLQINSYNNVMQTITHTQHEHPSVKIRSTVFPSVNLPTALYPYDYTNVQIQQQIKQGIADGTKAGLQSVQVPSSN